MTFQIVEDGEYTAPEPTDDLALAQKLVLEYISKGRMNALEDEKLDLLRTFLTQVQLLQMKAQPPASPAPSGPAPQAVPAAPPVSDILPNLPQG